MNTLVVYGTHYGSTQRYAEAIASSLDAVAVSYKELTKAQVEAADIMIFGGGIYVGKLVGSEILKTYEAVLKDKALIVFTCGSANTNDPKQQSVLSEYANSALPEALKGQAHIFFLRGDLNYRAMNFKHRMMMKMMVSMIKKKTERTEEEQQMIDGYDTDGSYFFDETTIQPLIACAKALEEAYENQK